jgi:tRNA uridine 5-carboxymethylaminomethyl modification enzyme
LIDRSEAYIGVLIDDLITKGVEEPYRIFTSRSEYRISLRADNADLRLTQKGYQVGCVSEARRTHTVYIEKELEAARKLLESIVESPSIWSRILDITVNMDGAPRSAKKMLEYANVSLNQLCNHYPSLNIIDPALHHRLEIESRYASYLRRQQQDIEAFKRDENLLLPDSIDYGKFAELSNEIKEKLMLHRPRTLGAANRIEGMTPSALLTLLKYIKR